jgi:hypothetical protein
LEMINRLEVGDRNRGGCGSKASGRGNAADGMIAEGSKTHLSGHHRGHPVKHTRPYFHSQHAQGWADAPDTEGREIWAAGAEGEKKGEKRRIVTW